MKPKTQLIGTRRPWERNPSECPPKTNSPPNLNTFAPAASRLGMLAREKTASARAADGGNDFFSS